MNPEPTRVILDGVCRRARQEFNAGVSEQRRAQIEHELWTLALPIDGGDPVQWMRERFGTTEEHYTGRALLFDAGAAADVLWAAIDKGSLSLGSAVAVLRAAKDLASSGTVEDLTLAVQLQLDERPPEPPKPVAAPEPTTPEPPKPPVPAPKPKRSHDRKGSPEVHNARKAAGGKASARVRKERYGTAQPPSNGRSAGGKASARARRARAAARAAAKVDSLLNCAPEKVLEVPEPKKPARRRGNHQPLDGGVEQTRKFRLQVRSAVSALISQYMDDRERREPVAEEAVFGNAQARQRLSDWIEQGIDNFFHDLRKASRDAHDHKLNKIGRLRFQQACEVLAISRVGKEKEPIFFGHKLSPIRAREFFDLVRERHHIRSADLHPDRIQARSGRPPNPAEIAEYQAIQQAREVLEEYIHQMTVR